LTKVQKAKGMTTKTSKKGEKLQKNTKKNGKESFNGTPKPNSMGCCRKEAYKLGVKKFWKELFF
jgi:hypothetical protein